MSTKFSRARWAAAGAAIAVTLGAGGLGLVDAAKGSGERAVYTAIEPCRLVDSRPEYGIGGRTTPLGPAEVYPITAHGDNGECTGIPGDVVALELNVTGLLNTGATHFTVWSGAGAFPNASHVNLAAGADPTPNSVTTELNGAGFAIRNNSATAHVIVDIVGIYQDHHHDDRYLTETVFGRTVDFPTNLAPEDDYPLDQVVTTTRAGRLLATMSFVGGAVCSGSANALVYLTIDDVPIPSSTVKLQSGTPARTTLTGVTTQSIAAGAHTLGVAVECWSTATVSSRFYDGVSTSSVTVLPTG
ncbi:MAG: hypothetical protein R2697_04065 [Ilumatobacteraceae bacterium]